jgi:hypothetical protein
VQRAKEIARNKKERKFQRDASKLKSNPDALKEELKEVQSSSTGHGQTLSKLNGFEMKLHALAHPLPPPPHRTATRR